METKRFLTTKELAEMASVTRTYIRRLCADGDIQAEKRGRDWLISTSAADRWLKERKKN